MSVGLFGTNKKTREDAIRKFVYFTNKHYKLMCRLVKRDVENTGFCSQMRSWTDISFAKSFIFGTLSESDTNHGICFNIAHYPTGRIELRLVGGQGNDYYTFRNTMEVIFHLVDKMKDISWKDIDNVAEVFKGCNKYVVKRLDDCLRYGELNRDDYEIIKANVNAEVDFGNY